MVGRLVSNLHPAVLRAVQLLLWLVIAFLAIRTGWQLRDWTWTATAPIRFRGDVGNAVRVASLTFDPPASPARADDPKQVDWSRVWHGYLNRYDRELARVETNHDPHRAIRDDNYTFDYPPGRLLIVTLWTAPVFVARGVGVGYDDSYVGPMLTVNSAHELMAAVGMFLFARLAFRRAGRGRFVSEAAGMAAALLTWFNPASIMDGHGWPQWDVWVLPYTIWAAYLALSDRWLLAGATLALGSMFKGQVLLIAPMFAIWPIVRLNGSALLRLLAGFGAAVAVLMSPWLLRASPAQVWAIGAIALAALGICCPRGQRFGPVWWTLVAAVAGWTLGPWISPVPAKPSVGHALLFVLALLPLERSRRLPMRGWWVARAAIVAMLASSAPAWTLGSLAQRLPGWFDLPAVAPAEGSNATFLAAAVLVTGVAGLSAVWRGRRSMWLAIFACAAIALAAVQYDGSTTWFTVGFQTDRYHAMTMGRAVNFSAILAQVYGLNVDAGVSLFGYLTPEHEWTLRSLMRGIAIGGIAAAGAAAAIQQWRRDANLVIALPAAWAMLFAFMPQMHERYLVWAAVTSSVLITRGIGGILIYVALTTLQLASLYAEMCEVNGHGMALLRDPWWRAANGLQPSAGWISATLAVTLLVWSFRRSAPPKALIAQPV